jgi:hypothetical protein
LTAAPTCRRRVFNASWSPLVPGLLLSVSDDATARAWDVPGQRCISVLSGHRSEVRGLAWHQALPHVAFTGRWAGCWEAFAGWHQQLPLAAQLQGLPAPPSTASHPLPGAAGSPCRQLGQ